MSTVDKKVLTAEEAVKVAGEVERLEAAVKQLKADLKVYVDQNGSLQAGDKIWGYSTTSSWDFDPQRLRELAMGIAVEGKNPWELLSLPADSLKKLGWDEAALLKYGTKKENKRFGSKKA
ncbi:hypothetical protein KIH86_03860 [Paenibacillus sp. HN-1]|uniref:hypothetical protein n=1 Tax=Paenibacillus TaxID=44249 RepID=UPI001CA8C2C2|nr:MULTISPECIES: hypothetical protein [Paenibacillus]MBY9079543.1 hypothetical protein [Paenibacillus sp. CGMCC 1.18879]MBY9083364.1 hypothetical protein [Paenibacillus sinensis]